MCYKLPLNIPVSAPQSFHINSNKETGITFTLGEREIEWYRLDSIHSSPDIEISHLRGLLSEEAVAAYESQTMPSCFPAACQQLRRNLPDSISTWGLESPFSSAQYQARWHPAPMQLLESKGSKRKKYFK